MGCEPTPPVDLLEVAAAPADLLEVAVPADPIAEVTAPPALVIAAETPSGRFVAEARRLLISLWPAARRELSEALAAGSVMEASAAVADFKAPVWDLIAAEREAIAPVLVAKEANAAVSMSDAITEAAAAEIWTGIFVSMKRRG